MFVLIVFNCEKESRFFFLDSKKSVNEFSYFLAKQHAEHVATNANIPITPAKMTSHVPADAITLAAVTVFLTAHDSIALTEYFSNKSTNDCFISSESISACISCGGNTEPCRDNWKHELKIEEKRIAFEFYF